MKAARGYRYGSPDVIRVEEIARPEPAENELLVRVRAATVSRTDCAPLAAQPFFIRLLTGLRAPKRKTLGTLDRIREAYEYAGSGQKTGCVVLDLAG